MKMFGAAKGEQREFGRLTLTGVVALLVALVVELVLSPGALAAPVVNPLSPKPGSTIRDRTPPTSAFVSDSATDLAKGDLRLFVDGQPRSFTYVTATDKLIRSGSTLSLGGTRSR